MSLFFVLACFYDRNFTVLNGTNGGCYTVRSPHFRDLLTSSFAAMQTDLSFMLVVTNGEVGRVAHDRNFLVVNGTNGGCYTVRSPHFRDLLTSSFAAMQTDLSFMLVVTNGEVGCVAHDHNFTVLNGTNGGCYTVRSFRMAQQQRLQAASAANDAMPRQRRILGMSAADADTEALEDPTLGGSGALYVSAKE